MEVYYEYGVAVHDIAYLETFYKEFVDKSIYPNYSFWLDKMSRRYIKWELEELKREKKLVLLKKIVKNAREYSLKNKAFFKILREYEFQKLDLKYIVKNYDNDSMYYDLLEISDAGAIPIPILQEEYRGMEGRVIKIIINSTIVYYDEWNYACLGGTLADEAWKFMETVDVSHKHLLKKAWKYFYAKYKYEEEIKIIWEIFVEEINKIRANTKYCSR